MSAIPGEWQDLRLQDSDPVYEIIDGRRVELPPTSAYASVVASRLAMFVEAFARSRSLGQTVVQAFFRLSLPMDRQRRPDAGYVSYQRWAKARPIPPEDNAWNVAPDLTIESVGPKDRAEDLIEKVEEYFRSGVRLAWVVYPRRRLVYVYESATAVRGLTDSDDLEGGDVLPGFRLPLAELFQEPTEPALTLGRAP